MGTSEFLEGLYGDPLRVETSRSGRSLIILSAICIVSVLFNVGLQSTSLVPLNFGSHVEVLPMLLSLAVLLMLLNFVMRAATDVFHDFETGVLVTRYIQSEQVNAATEMARAADRDMEEQQRANYGADNDADPWWQQVFDVEEAARQAVREAEKRVGIRAIPRVARQLRKWVEIVVPILFALIALFLARDFLLQFATALMNALRPF